MAAGRRNPYSTRFIFPRKVSSFIPPYLRKRNVALVDDCQEILGEIVKRGRTVAFLVRVRRNIVNSSRFRNSARVPFYHFYVVRYTLFSVCCASRSLPSRLKKSTCAPRSRAIWSMLRPSGSFVLLRICWQDMLKPSIDWSRLFSLSRSTVCDSISSPQKRTRS